MPQDVTAPEITRVVPLPVYINVYVCILTSESILQSSTELAHVGYIICVYSGFVYFLIVLCFYIKVLLSQDRSLGRCF